MSAETNSEASRAFALADAPPDAALRALLELGDVAADADAGLAADLSSITTPWLRRVFRPGEEVSFRTASGIVFNVDGGDIFAATAAAGYVSEARDFEAFMRLVQPGAVVVDVGANFGLYALSAALYAQPGGRVYAFEPAPGAFATLQRNINANAFGQMFEYRAAVGAEAGQATFHIAQDVSFSSLHDTGRSPEAETINVDVVTLDEALASVSDIDLLKIDVEGAEAEVFRGAKALMSRSPNLIVLFEFSHKNLSEARRASLAQSIAQLHQQGFRLYRRGSAESVDRLPSAEDQFSGNLYLARKGEAEARLLATLAATGRTAPAPHEQAGLALLRHFEEQKRALHQSDALQKTIQDIAVSVLEESAPAAPLDAIRAVQAALLSLRKRLLDAESQVAALKSTVEGHERLAAQSQEKMAALRAASEAFEANGRALRAERDKSASKLEKSNETIAELQAMVKKQGEKLAALRAQAASPKAPS